MKTTRDYTLPDKWIMAFDRGLRTVFSSDEKSERENPAAAVKEDETLTGSQQKKSAAFMRVNHAGEVCAQALYDGQAFTARDLQVRASLIEAASEEQDHLKWCEHRLKELKSHTSYLNPVWYSGSFIIGMCAGMAGDRWNLGFVAETERQVLEHLKHHLSCLPKNDKKSEEILKQMCVDESKHATTAMDKGAYELPLPIRLMMRAASKVMTTLVYWV